MRQPQDSGGADIGRILDAASWRAVAVAYRDAAERYGYVVSVVAIDIDLEGGGAVPARIVNLVASSVRGCDLVARGQSGRVVILAVGCPLDHARSLADRLRNALEGAGLHATVSVWALVPDGRSDPGADVAVPRLHGQGPRFAMCGQCHLRGAYVSNRFPVVRCKFCGAKRRLVRLEWPGAFERLDELAVGLGDDLSPDRAVPDELRDAWR